MPSRNKEVERSVDEVIRLAEHSPCGDAAGTILPDSTKLHFRQHHARRLHLVACFPTNPSYLC